MGYRAISIPPLWTRQEKQVCKNPVLTTVSPVGMASPTLDVTVTNADDADGPWLNHATTNVSGNKSGVLATGYVACRCDWLPEFVATVKLVAVTAVRLWVGLVSSSANETSSTPNTHAAAFRYATDVDGTAFWRCVTIAGTGATAQVTVTNVAAAAGVKHTFRIMCGAAAVEFYIDDVRVATHATVLPGPTVLMGYTVRVVTLEAVIKNVKWGRLVLRHV
jgi:hypothetical protein